MLKKIIVCILTLLFVSNSSCFFFDSLDRRLEKKESKINNTISYVLQSQEIIIKILTQKTIDKKRAIDINTLNKYFSYFIQKPLERELKYLRSDLIIKNKKNTKNITKVAKNTEKKLTIDKHLKILTLLQNKLSTALSNQKLIMQMADEHPSQIFKEITASSYIGMNILSHLYFAACLIIDFLFLYSVLAQNYVIIFIIFSPFIIVYSVLIPLTWYQKQQYYLRVNYYEILSKYQSNLFQNETIQAMEIYS